MPTTDLAALRSWREELYEVRTEFDQPPLLKMERAATRERLNAFF